MVETRSRSRWSFASRRVIETAGLLLVLICAESCTWDAAEREYLAALRGDEEDMTREEQIAHLDRALEIAPERARYFETRAIYRIDMLDFDRALSDLDRAIELAERPYLRFLHGLVLCQSGRYREALPDFDAAIVGQPENTQFYRGRALARVHAGVPMEALEDADRLVTLVPQQAESHYARGRALAELDRDKEALAEYNEAIRQRPELVYPLRARADCLERLGDSAGARADHATADRLAAERRNCRLCLDPFRY